MTSLHTAAELLHRLLNPEDLGWRVSPEVRDYARRVLCQIHSADLVLPHKHFVPKLYIAGPMSGLPDYNYPAFIQAARDLRACGYKVFCPAQNGLPANAPWQQHMRVDLMQLMQCEAVATLPGWEVSRGARLETMIARELGMRIQSVEQWLQEPALQEQPALGEEEPYAQMRLAA